MSFQSDFIFPRFLTSTWFFSIRRSLSRENLWLVGFSAGIFQRLLLLVFLCLGVATAAASGVTVTWNDNSADETGFSVERGRDGLSFAEIATVAANTTAYTDSGLAAGQYWYRVRAFNGGAFSGYSETVNITLVNSLVVPSLPVIAFQPANISISQGATASFSVSATSAAALSYQWKKNGVDIPNAIFSSYSIFLAQANDAAVYTVAVTNSAGTALSQTATLTVTSSAASVALSGTVICSAPWSNMSAYSGGKVFDGDTNSFFSGQSTDALVYVGLDFGSPKLLQSISYFPRAGFPARMNGGRFRGANRADLADAVTLYTVSAIPPEGQWQTVSLTSSTAYRYVFYTTDSSNQADISEIKFSGLADVVTLPVSQVSLLTGTTISSNPWSDMSAYSGTKVFDGDTTSFFSGRSNDALVYVGQDLGAARVIDAISYYPRASWAWRMNGGKFRGANRADLSDAVTLYTIPATPPEGQWTDVTLPAATAAYRYVFYTTASSYQGDVAEVEFYGHEPVIVTGGGSGAIISGTTISSAPWNDLSTYQGSKAFDNDTSTFFSGKSWDAFVYVGQDCGSSKQVGAISFFPRYGFNARMKGGRFCGANKADLSDAAVLYTIPVVPVEGVWQTITLSPSTNSYRYLFYTTDPANSADVAELKFNTP